MKIILNDKQFEEYKENALIHTMIELLKVQVTKEEKLERMWREINEN